MFSDSIDNDMLISGIRFMRESLGQNASGDYGSVATTIAHTIKGDVQPSSASAYRMTAQGSDYLITHKGFFDVPAAVPVVGDKCVADGVNYQVRGVQNFKTHLQCDLEHLGT